jgi:hypothetical protein
MSIRMEEAFVPERPCKRSCGTGLSEAHPPEAFQGHHWWIYPAGMSRGQGTHAGTSTFRARWAMKDRGRDGAVRRAPRLACLRGILPPSLCSLAPQPRVTQRQTCALFFLICRRGSSGIVPSMCRELLDTSTPDVKALRASAGWRAKARVSRTRRDEMGTTLRWASADLEVLHNDDKRYEIMVGLWIGNSGQSGCTGARDGAPSAT